MNKCLICGSTKIYHDFNSEIYNCASCGARWDNFSITVSTSTMTSKIDLDKLSKKNYDLTKAYIDLLSIQNTITNIINTIFLKKENFENSENTMLFIKQKTTFLLSESSFVLNYLYDYIKNNEKLKIKNKE